MQNLRYFLTVIAGAFSAVALAVIFPSLIPAPVTEVLGAPETQATFQKNLIPMTDSTYTLGTTTKTWLNLYTDEICLAGDCQTSWPSGSGSGGSNWTFNGTTLTPSTTPVGIVVNGTSTLAGATLSGKLLASAGSAGIPSITFSGDQDTGLYNTANTVGISAGGSGRLLVNSSVVRTTVDIDSNVSPGFHIELGDGTASNPYYTVSDDLNTGLYFPIGVADNLGLTTGGVDRLRINDVGYVGIGTTSPSRKLTVQGGDAWIGGNLTATGTATIGTLTGLLRADSGVVSTATLGTDYGDVTKVGTPVDNQVGVWTGDGTLEGDSALTFSSALLRIIGTANTNGLRIGDATSVAGIVVDASQAMYIGAGANGTGASIWIRPEGVADSSFQSNFTSTGGLNLAGTLTASKATLTDTTDSSANTVLTIQSDRATPSANDQAIIDIKLSDSAGNQTSFVKLSALASTVTDTSEVGRFYVGLVDGGTFANKYIFTPTTFIPFTTDGPSLGSTANQWSDLYLAEGGVINWDNGDATLTQVGNMVTLAGADLTVPNATSTTSFFSALGTFTNLVVNTLATFLNVVVTGLLDVGGGSLEIPNGTAPTVDAIGEIAVDSTYGQLKYFDGGTTHVFTGTTTRSFSIASTTSGTGGSFNTATTTFLLANNPEQTTLIGWYCMATTTGSVSVRFGDGTNWTNSSSCSTGGTTYASSNNTFTAFENFQVQIGTSASSPNRVTITTFTSKTAQ